MTTVEESVVDYLASRQRRGVAPNTLRNDKQSLAILVQHCGDQDVTDLSAEDIDLWSDRQAKLAAGTVNVRQSHMTGYLSWLEARGHHPTAKQLTEGYWRRKAMPRERLRVPLHRFNELLDATTHPGDRLLIALGLFLMLRQSEITDLRISDVDFQQGLLTVRVHKTKQLDHMPICTELEVELRRYLNWYQQVPDAFLVPSKVNPMGRRSRPHEPVKKALAALGFDVSYREGTHTLRRSGARALFDELAADGYDGALRTVQAMLHHASSQMTETYLGVSADRRSRDDRFMGQRMYPSLIASSNVWRLPV